MLYRLIDIFEPGGMFDQRRHPALFASYGSFAGNGSGGCGKGAFACTKNAANAPWGWDDRDDAEPRGALATDPAGLMQRYFTVSETLSERYTWNAYR